MTTPQLKPVGADESPELYQKLAAHDLMPLWKLATRLNTTSPRPKAVPFRWRWADMEPLAALAGQEVPITRGGDRRVLRGLPVHHPHRREGRRLGSG